jgi:hypothetical protein
VLFGQPREKDRPAHGAILVTERIGGSRALPAAPATTLPAGAKPQMSPRHISSLLTNLYTFRDIAN